MAINGWYDNVWMPSFEPSNEFEGYENFEDYFSSSEERIFELTGDQNDRVEELADDCEGGNQPEYVSEERCGKIRALRDEAFRVMFKNDEYQTISVVDLDILF